MAQAFQIERVDRSLTNWGHHHITAVGTAPKPGFDDVWPVDSVVKALDGGELFYTVTAWGEPAFARPYRCWCGFETVRATPGDAVLDGMENLPPVGRRAQEHAPAAS